MKENESERSTGFAAQWGRRAGLHVEKSLLRHFKTLSWSHVLHFAHERVHLLQKHVRGVTRLTLQQSDRRRLRPATHRGVRPSGRRAAREPSALGTRALRSVQRALRVSTGPARARVCWRDSSCCRRAVRRGPIPRAASARKRARARGGEVSPRVRAPCACGGVSRRTRAARTARAPCRASRGAVAATSASATPRRLCDAPLLSHRPPVGPALLTGSGVRGRSTFLYLWKKRKKAFLVKKFNR